MLHSHRSSRDGPYSWEHVSSGEDWRGLEAYVDTLQMGHDYPFYFVDYVIAQIGALQVWRNTQVDAEQALDAYLSALRLGNTKPVPEIYMAAGARLDLSRDKLAELADLVLDRIEQLES